MRISVECTKSEVVNRGDTVLRLFGVKRSKFGGSTQITQENEFSLASEWRYLFLYRIIAH